MLYPRNIRDSNLVDWTLLKGMWFVTVWNTVEGRRAKRTAWNWGARLNFALHVTYSCWSVNIECWAGHWSCNYCSCEPHVQKSFSRNILDMGQMADCYLILFIDICCWRWRHFGRPFLTQGIDALVGQVPDVTDFQSGAWIKLRNIA